MALCNTSSSYRKDIDDGAIGKPEMLKDFTEEWNGVEKGLLVLSQDRLFSCNNRIESLQSLMDWAYVWSQSECSEGWCPSTWLRPPKDYDYDYPAPDHLTFPPCQPAMIIWKTQTSNWATWPSALAALLPNCWLANDLRCSSSVTALKNRLHHDMIQVGQILV